MNQEHCFSKQTRVFFSNDRRDCFKWGYPFSLSLISEMTIRESMANVNQDLLDINRQLTIVMSLSDENGVDWV